MIQTILGANGPVATELAKQLSTYQTEIRLVSRNPKKVNASDHIMSLDLTQKENIFEAVQGSSVVYVTIGFPYNIKFWRKLWVPFMKAVIDACLKNNSKLVFFDNVYAIGGTNVNHITESSPISPGSKKGEVRAEVDELILQNIMSNKLKAIIARAPDFFSAGAGKNSMLISQVYDNLVRGKKARWLCDATKVHSLAYVPEIAKGTAMLGNTEEAYGQVWNLPTDHAKLTGKEWIELVAREIGCEPKYTVLPNWLFKTLGIFVPFMAELAEMNYQYNQHYFFDSSKFNHYFDHTPITNERAVKETVQALKQINNS